MVQQTLELGHLLLASNDAIEKLHLHGDGSSMHQIQIDGTSMVHVLSNQNAERSSCLLFWHYRQNLQGERIA